MNLYVDAPTHLPLFTASTNIYFILSRTTQMGSCNLGSKNRLQITEIKFSFHAAESKSTVYWSFNTTYDVKKSHDKSWVIIPYQNVS